MDFSGLGINPFSWGRKGCPFSDTVSNYQVYKKSCIGSKCLMTCMKLTHLFDCPFLWHSPSFQLYFDGLITECNSGVPVETR